MEAREYLNQWSRFAEEEWDLTRDWGSSVVTLVSGRPLAPAERQICLGKDIVDQAAKTGLARLRSGRHRHVRRRRMYGSVAEPFCRN